MNPHGGLFISVPASPLSRRRERSAATPTPFQMAFSQFHKCLRPTPPTPPEHWSASAPPLAAPDPLHQPYSTRNCLSCGHADSVRSVSRAVQEKPSVLRPRRFGAAPTQVQHIRNPPRTGTKSVPERRAVSSYSLETAPGKPCADSHSARRCDESAVLRSAACGCSSPSATPITIHTATVIRQQGLLVRVP